MSRLLPPHLLPQLLTDERLTFNAFITNWRSFSPRKRLPCSLMMDDTSKNELSGLNTTVDDSAALLSSPVVHIPIALVMSLFRSMRLLVGSFQESLVGLNSNYAQEMSHVYTSAVLCGKDDGSSGTRNLPGQRRPLQWMRSTKTLSSPLSITNTTTTGPAGNPWTDVYGVKFALRIGYIPGGLRMRPLRLLKQLHPDSLLEKDDRGREVKRQMSDKEIEASLTSKIRLVLDNVVRGRHIDLLSYLLKFYESREPITKATAENRLYFYVFNIGSLGIRFDLGIRLIKQTADLIGDAASLLGDQGESAEQGLGTTLLHDCFSAEILKDVHFQQKRDRYVKFLLHELNAKLRGSKRPILHTVVAHADAPNSIAVSIPWWQVFVEEYGCDPFEVCQLSGDTVLQIAIENKHVESYVYFASSFPDLLGVENKRKVNSFPPDDLSALASGGLNSRSRSGAFWNTVKKRMEGYGRK